MKSKKLRKLTDEELIKRMKEVKLKLAKDTGFRHWKDGGHDAKWHPNFREMKREIAKIKTILNERKLFK